MTLTLHGPSGCGKTVLHSALRRAGLSPTVRVLHSHGNTGFVDYSSERGGLIDPKEPLDINTVSARFRETKHSLTGSYDEVWVLFLECQRYSEQFASTLAVMKADADEADVATWSDRAAKALLGLFPELAS